MATPDTENARHAHRYRNLIRNFIDGNASAEEFRIRILSAFKDDASVPSDLFDVLDELCADADCYISDPELREDRGGLDDDALRTCALKAYRELDATNTAPAVSELDAGGNTSERRG